MLRPLGARGAASAAAGRSRRPRARDATIHGAGKTTRTFAMCERESVTLIALSSFRLSRNPRDIKVGIIIGDSSPISASSASLSAAHASAPAGGATGRIPAAAADAPASEVEVLCRLQHPNCTRLYGVWRAQERLNILMEYADGGTSPTGSALGARRAGSRLVRTR